MVLTKMSGFNDKSAAADASFDGYLVIDFAVTSLKDMKINPQEIIEIAVQLVDARTFAVSKEFTKYVKPLHRIKLTPFCTKVTGVSKSTILNCLQIIEMTRCLRNISRRCGRGAIFPSPFCRIHGLAGRYQHRWKTRHPCCSGSPVEGRAQGTVLALLMCLS